MSLPSCPQYLSLYNAWRKQVAQMRHHAEAFRVTASDEAKEKFAAAKEQAAQAKLSLDVRR